MDPFIRGIMTIVSRARREEPRDDGGADLISNGFNAAFQEIVVNTVEFFGFSRRVIRRALRDENHHAFSEARQQNTVFIENARARIVGRGLCVASSVNILPSGGRELSRDNVTARENQIAAPQKPNEIDFKALQFEFAERDF